MSTPLTNDPDGILSGDCRRLSGGDRQKGIRVFADGQVPRMLDADAIVNDCERLAGGNKKPTVGDYVLSVKNKPDLIWRDDDLVLVQEENDDLLIVNYV